MKHPSGGIGFWVHGSRNYVRALADATAEQLAGLGRQLDAADTPAEKEQIERRMAAVRAELTQKCADARFSLF